MLKELEIAGMVCPNNVMLAPLAGYTNFPFREMCRRLGAGLTFTEMVSCKGLMYGNEETKKLLYHGEDIPGARTFKAGNPESGTPGAVAPKAAQIFGCDPAIMRAACEGEDLAPFDLIDIN
ncbi:MAG: tRNA-dihydrouridine synthase, partial [Clostridia bacterium]|nr:tRNA-dihydrouridine synthase [Clostridia bacterium]